MTCSILTLLLAAHTCTVVPVDEVPRAEHLGIWFGYSLARIGDVDGDGLSDFVVGSPLGYGTENVPCGVFAISSATGEILYEVAGEKRLGETVAALGDIDGDGVWDFAATRWNWRVDVFSGATGNLLRVHDSPSQFWFSEAVSVTGIPDVNEDGIPEVLIGRSDQDGLRMHSGADGAELLHIKPDSNTRLGDRVLGLADVNGDGAGDLAFTRCEEKRRLDPAQTDPKATEPSVAVVVACGRTGDLLYSFELDQCSTSEQVRLAAAGDVNGDGAADFAVSVTISPESDPVLPGRVELRSGKTGDLLDTLQNDLESPSFGYAVDGGGARSGGALLISQYGVGMFYSVVAELDPPDAGGIYSFSPSAGKLESLTREDRCFGRSVLWLGDVDRDGAPDYAVGVTPDRAGDFEQGYVSVYSSATGERLYRIPPVE